jgi:AcrR family transcriptional regulator
VRGCVEHEALRGVRAAVLQAAIAELLRTGYAGLWVEAVAERAGVHNTTVYRRWGTPQRLVTDALLATWAAGSPSPTPARPVPTWSP